MEVKVEVYKRRKQMESGLSKLLNDGWSLVAQSGQLTNNPTTMLFSGSRVTCTLTRNRG